MKTKKTTIPDLTNSVLGNCRIDPSCNAWFIRKLFLLRILAVVLMGASLALFLCSAGGVSYGDSATSRPLSVTASAQFWPTFGTPNDTLVTDDDAYVLVSVTGDATPCPGETTPPPTTFSTGVQVFSKPDFTNPCGGDRIINFPSLNHRDEAVQKIDGMQFFPGAPQVSVGAAIERQGAEFFGLTSLTAPCGMGGVVNVPQTPVKNCPDCPNCPPGSFDVAVTPDGQYAFVANEYGTLPSPTPATLIGGGTIGIIQIQRDGAGGFERRGTRPIARNSTIYIPGGDTIPGITMSHDGLYLYVACEGSAEGINPDTGNLYRDPTSARYTRNGVVLCPGCRYVVPSQPLPLVSPRSPDISNACDNESKKGRTRNGLLAVIDVDMAIKGMGQASIIRIIASGCSPVRAVETADGQNVWVAARGRNTILPLPPQQGASGSQVLGFNRSLLLSAPNDALVGYADTHGTAPVGLALFNNDTLLAVANSNRFHHNAECVHPPPGVPPCTANVAIMDVSNPAEPTVIQTVPAYSNDAFPRNLTLGPDGSTLYVPNADVDQLEVITTSVN